ncbi:MAG: epoxide hydrolase [Roseiflexus castenholzii]|uniref:alpha/beta fold hydrolase n=1 Tax=Roseiflexus castenholzii TaxID=120962 RepID=UPI000CBC499C|nr:MAG: epoxide hydrolase [Roseiflexus castenholzii]
MPASLEHHYLNANGIRFHVVRAGNGDRLLLLLHGFPEFWWSWRHQIEVFAAHYTVVAPDLRGYNETEKPARGYELHVLVQDVVELIQTLGFQRAYVAGHDWGGMIAWSLAIARPERVERLIALNMPHPARFYEELQRNPEQRRRSRYILFFQIPWLPEAILSANHGAAFNRIFRSTPIDRAVFDDETIRRYKQAMARPGALTAALNYYRAIGRHGAGDLFRGTGMRVRAPTLLIWGEQDVAFAPEVVRETQRFVPDLRICSLPHASHWVQQVAPDEVNAAMKAFLEA